MAISRLNLVSINFDKYRYNEVLLKLFSHDDFHPELASKFIDSVTGLSVYNQDNLYEEILVRLNDASNKYNFKLEEVEVENNQINILKVKEYLDDLLLDVERIHAVIEQLDTMIIENQEAVIQLRHVADIDVDFDDLFSCKYLQIRFGKLPVNNISKLDYYESLPFVFKAFEHDNHYTWCILQLLVMHQKLIIFFHHCILKEFIFRILFMVHQNWQFMKLKKKQMWLRNTVIN